jgi:hypothetical protein
MEGFDAECGGVGAVVSGDLEFGAAEPGLDICGRGGKNGLVGEGYFDGDGVCIELCC